MVDVSTSETKDVFDAGMLNNAQWTHARDPVPQGDVSSSIISAYFAVSAGEFIQLNWGDAFEPPSAVHACVRGIAVPSL